MKSNLLVNYRPYFTLSLLILLGLLISCNNERGRGPRRGMNASELKTRLNLTDDQTEKVEQIIETFRRDMQDLRDNSSGDWSEIREQMMDMRNKQNEQIEELLTEEQKLIWEEIKKERQDRNERRRRDQGDEQRNP